MLSNDNTSPDTYFVNNMVKRGLLFCEYLQTHTFLVRLVLEKESKKTAPILEKKALIVSILGLNLLFKM